MKHRHLVDDAGWCKAAIYSVLERGDLPDWRELFATARNDEAIACAILEVVRHHPIRRVRPIVDR